ncbi:MAG: phospho-N-acetylmuramoyl-pentapeptide-transferase [bacterium]|nr:phospho-N-acetylmuramoyl-pentapeptide-transferase [bacterium]
MLEIFILSLLISLLVGYIVWRFLIVFKMWQPIKAYGPRNHFAKSGTPTMGGLSFILTFYIILGFALLEKITAEVAFVAGAGFLCSIVGVFDDVIKIRKGSDGVKAKTKFGFQLLFSLLCLLFLRLLGLYSTEVYVPFFSVFDLAVFYPFFALFLFLGCMNAVNITDGLDGLACGSSIIALVSFFIISLWKEKVEIAFVIVILIGSLLGFLLYNRHPAKMFMGDIGSMFLGGILASLGIILKVEVLLLFIGGIFVLETLSVMIQVGSYKLRKKRVFLMSPLHHHFELKGWKEKNVVRFFWTLELALSSIGLIIYRFG